MTIGDNLVDNINHANHNDDDYDQNKSENNDDCNYVYVDHHALPSTYNQQQHHHDHHFHQENGSFEIVFDLLGYDPNPESPMYTATFTTPDSGHLSIRSLFHLSKRLPLKHLTCS